MQSNTGHHNVPEYSVSEISQALKRVVEGNFEHVRVRGEISGFKQAASGHMYMTLKDSDAVLSGVCWRGVAGRLGITPEDGLEVIAIGKLTTYGGRSQYQMVIEGMEMAGEGAILKMLEERKKRLAAEGLFDPECKKPLPYLPQTIGVVSSPTGAVIHDILTTLERRFPSHVVFAPVTVQGEGAAEEVAAAIHGFSNLPDNRRPDVLIVARGGGSLEDLLPFSEEIIIRAVAACPIPVISSVGHETDTMLIDLAADRRAPTPTAAAEMATPVRDELLAFTEDLNRRLRGGLQRFLQNGTKHLEGLSRGLINPDTQLINLAQRLDDRSERLTQSLKTYFERLTNRLPTLRPPKEMVTAATLNLEKTTERLVPTMTRRLDQQQERLQNLSQLLESYSYKGVLERGFAVVRNSAGEPVMQARSLQPNADVELIFQDGIRSATIKGAIKGE